jgi:hypothetical protein
VREFHFINEARVKTIHNSIVKEKGTEARRKARLSKICETAERENNKGVTEQTAYSFS